MTNQFQTNRSGSSPDARNPFPFQGIKGEIPATDIQYLMTYPFFSLARNRRVKPIDFRSNGVAIRVEADEAHGMATIQDADILIWATSQIAESINRKRRTSRLIVATPYQILAFINRGNSGQDYRRLKAALNRLQTTTIITSIRQKAGEPSHRFSWISDWRELSDPDGKSIGIEITLSRWLYRMALDRSVLLKLDREYFALTGGLERWLYRLVRKHGGYQKDGWKFEFAHLYRKSGVLSPFRRFSFELKQLVKRQPLPGYELTIETDPDSGKKQLVFKLWITCGKPASGNVPSVTRNIVLSGATPSCFEERKHLLSHGNKKDNRALNLESNTESNFNARARSVENLARTTAQAMRAFPKTKKGNGHG